MHRSIALVGLLFATVPYLLVAAGYMAFTGHGAKMFGVALAVLLTAKVIFAITDLMSDALAWRIFRKKIFVKNAVEWLRANNFPMREDRDSTFPGYLMDIQEEFKYGESVKARAQALKHGLEYIEEVLPKWKVARVWGAWNAALELYSPPAARPRRFNRS